MSQHLRETKEETFWTWFEQNEARLYLLEDDQENIFDEISAQLTSYREGLAFEISTARNGKREFIISADGLNELFPAVERLVAASPKFARWSIIAFRPRIEDYAQFKLDYGGRSFDPAEIWIHLHVDKGHFDLTIFHPDYNEEERNLFIFASYILLDMALGEYSVVKCLRYIDHQRLPSDPEQKGLRPFSELRKIFDEYRPSGH